LPEHTAHREQTSGSPPAAATAIGRDLSGRVSFFGRMVRIVTSKTVLAITGQGFASAANFLTGLIIIRSCTKEEYGLYYLGFTLTMFLVEQQNALISTPYTVYAPRLSREQRSAYAGSTLLHQGVFSGFITLGFAVAALAFLIGSGPEGSVRMAGALALFAAWVLLRDFARRVCFAELQMRAALGCDVAAAALQIGALALLAWAGGLSAPRAYAVVGVSSGVVAVAWLAGNRTLFTVRGGRAWNDFLRNWSFGKWVFASGLVWSLSMNFYPWILTGYQGRAATGIFGACMTVVALGNILVLGVQNFIGPKVASVYALEGPLALRRFLLRANAAFAVPMLLLCVFLGLFGEPVIVLLYGQEYAGNAATLSVLGFNLLALALGSTFSRGLFAIERADVDFAVNFVALVVLLALGLWLVKAYGVVGAAGALLAANAAALTVRGGAFLLCISALREKPAG
jgi:O-antigen/teichoic acid export membrane protein